MVTIFWNNFYLKMSYRKYSANARKVTSSLPQTVFFDASIESPRTLACFRRSTLGPCWLRDSHTGVSSLRKGFGNWNQLFPLKTSWRSGEVLTRKFELLPRGDFEQVKPGGRRKPVPRGASPDSEEAAETPGSCQGCEESQRMRRIKPQRGHPLCVVVHPGRYK